jgi:hypothetical protein
MSTDRKLDRDWPQAIRYPDPAIDHLDCCFATIRIGIAAIERISPHQTQCSAA